MAAEAREEAVRRAEVPSSDDVRACGDSRGAARAGGRDTRVNALPWGFYWGRWPVVVVCCRGVCRGGGLSRSRWGEGGGVGSAPISSVGVGCDGGFVRLSVPMS